MEVKKFLTSRVATMAMLAVFAVVLSAVYSGETLAGGAPADMLRAQLEDMQKQMSEMQQKMMGMQQRINELEARPPVVETRVTAPAVAAKAPEIPPPSVWTKYNMRLYGKVKMDVSYDTAQFKNYNDFVGAVAMDPNYANDSTDFNPRDTRFGFEASSQMDDWLALGRFEIDFYGDNNGNNLLPRMRLGYIDLSNKSGTSIRAGQDWIPISQLNPNTVDFGILTAAGNLWWRVPQVVVRHQMGDVEALLGAMMHRRTDTAREDRMPWVLARLAYNGAALGKGGTFAVGGGYRYADYRTNSSNSVDRWLVTGEAKYVMGPLTLQGEIWSGEGVGENFLRYELDMTGNGQDAAAAWGAWADITYALSPKMTFTAGYGRDDPDNKDIDGVFSDRRFTKNEQYYLNTWYSITQPLKVGAEWIHLETQRDNDVNVGNRFTVSMQYLF